MPDLTEWAWGTFADVSTLFGVLLAIIGGVFSAYLMTFRGWRLIRASLNVEMSLDQSLSNEGSRHVRLRVAVENPSSVRADELQSALVVRKLVPDGGEQLPRLTATGSWPAPPHHRANKVTTHPVRRDEVIYPHNKLETELVIAVLSAHHSLRPGERIGEDIYLLLDANSWYSIEFVSGLGVQEGVAELDAANWEPHFPRFNTFTGLVLPPQYIFQGMNGTRR